MFKKWIIIFLAFLVVLVIAANLLLNSGFFSEKLKETIVSPLETLTGRTVQVQRVGLHLFPFYLLLDGLTFSQRAAQPIAPLKVAQAKIDFNPWSLLTEVFVINKISLVDPVAHLVEPSELSGPHLKTFFPSSSSTAGESTETKGTQKKKVPILTIRAVEISGGHLFVNLPDGSPHLEFSHLSSLIEPDLLMQNFRIILKTGATQVTDPRWGGSLDQLEASLLLHPGEIEIKQLSASSRFLSTTIRGTVRMDHPVSMTLQLETVASLTFIRQFLELKRDWIGEARFTGDVTGSYPDLTIKGPVSFHNLVLDQQSIGDAAASLDYQNQVLTLTDITGSLFSGKVHGDITLKTAESFPGFDLTLELENLRTDTLLALLFPNTNDRPAGLNLNGKMLSGKLSLSGSGMTVEALHGDGSLTLTQDHPSDRTAPDVENSFALISSINEAALRFHTSDGQWEISQADFRTPSSSLSLQGSIHPDHSIHFTAHLNTQRLNELTLPLGHPELDGQGTVIAKLTGSLVDPKYQGEVVLKSFSIHNRPLGSFFSRYRYSKPLLTLSQAVIRHGESLTTGNGKLIVPADLTQPTFELQIRFSHCNPQDLLALAGKEFSMATPISGEIKLSAKTKKLVGKGTLTLAPGLILNQPVEAGEISIKMSDDQLQITKISLKTKKSVMEGSGFLAMDGRYSTRLKSFNFNLEDFEWLHLTLPALQGHGPITIHGSGNLQDPKISAQVTLKDMTYAGRALGEGRMEFRMAGHQAEVTVSSDAGLKLKSTLQVASPFPFRAELTVDSIQLDPWVALWYPSAVSKIKMQSSGVFQLKGDLEHLNDVAVHAKLANLSLNLAGYQVNNDGDIEAAYDQGQLAIRSFKLKGEGTSLTILGRVRFEYDYDLLITGEADLGLLQLVTPEIPYGNGTTYLAMRLYDQWKDPKLQGGLILRNGTIRIGGLFQTMTIRSLGISFDERQLLLESLDGEIGKGHLEGSGKVELKNLRVEGFGLLLEVTDLVVPSFYGFGTTMDGTLVFQGTPKTKDLRGEINIKKALYEKRSDIKTVAVSAPGTKPEASKPGDLPIFGDTALNIHLSGKDHLWVNNNVAKLPLQVDLALRGTLNHPILLGRIEALDGLAFFQSNEFKLTTAVVEFVNPERPKPVFEIKATTVIRDYRITMRLSGTLDKFRVNLTSDPPLNDTDLFSLLLIGKTAKEVTQQVQGVGVAETPLLIPEEVQRRLLATTGRFFMQSSSVPVSPGKGKTPRFAIVKKLIGDKLFLIYTVNLETSEEHLIRIEHRMTENLTMIGERDPESGMSHEILVRVKSKA